MVKQTSSKAKLSGSLVTLPTVQETVVEVRTGCSCWIRVKDTSIRRVKPSFPGPNVEDPFLPPYEADVVVSEQMDDYPEYAMLLNKFNVLDNHALVVTRAFESQSERLSARDLSVLRDCVLQLNGLGFYNCGLASGMSQPHKHLQIVPLSEPVPFDSIIRGSVNGHIPQFQFKHRCLLLDTQSPAEIAEAYLEMLSVLECLESRCAHNVLMTEDWLLVVPRTNADGMEGLPVNALAYAGMFLALNSRQLAHLHSPEGIMESLVHCGSKIK